MTNMGADDVAAVAYASSALDVSTETISMTTAAMTSSAVSEIFLQTVAAKAIAGVFAVLSIIIACVQVCFIFIQVVFNCQHVLLFLCLCLYLAILALESLSFVREAFN